MRDRLLLMGVVTFLILTSAHARLDCITETKYVGCGMDATELWSCDGKMIDRHCDKSTGLCTGVCEVTNDNFISRSECSTQLVSVASSDFGVVYLIGGKYDDIQVNDLYRSSCPYGYISGSSANIRCLDWTFSLFGIEIGCKHWETSGVYHCREVVCAGSIDQEAVTCSQILTETKPCSETIVGSCSREGSFCDDGSVTVCDANGGYYHTDMCEKKGLECITVSDYHALCVNPEEEESILECEDEGSYRCNPVEMRWAQQCKNGVWQNYEQCTMSCNSSGVNSSATRCVSHNIEVGGCVDETTFCHDTGVSAYYFLCVNNDWLLMHKCATSRCNVNGSGCYGGCNHYETFYYPENLTGYYCNADGVWIQSGECLGVVNNVTRQCELPETCVIGAVTCANGWTADCVNNEWRYIEKCTYGCESGACKSEGADIFDNMSYMADFLAIFLPNLTMFITIILSAGMLGYLLIKIWGRVNLWIQGRP